MNILFAVHGYKPAFRLGGPIHSVSALAEGLVRRGHRVVVFTTNSNLDRELDVPTDCPIDVCGVEVWYFRRTMLLERFRFLPYFARSVGFLYVPKMAGELRRILTSIDLVHTHMPFNYPNAVAAQAAIKSRKPLFYHQRGALDPARLRFRALKKRLYIELIEKPILRRATTLIALTSAEQDSYRRLGIATPCYVIPNGIHIEASTPNDEAAEDRFGIPEHVPVLLFLGRIHPTKGVDLLLEALVSISEKFPNAILVLAGPDEFGLERHFRDTASRLSLTGRVFFTGMVSGSDKEALFKRANLFCLPSIAEGFSIAVLEAMARGVPVLLSPGCHFPEVEKADAGRVVTRSVSAISNAVIELLSDREHLKTMGRNARGLVERAYGWNLIVDQTIDVYVEGVARHRKEILTK